MGRQIIFFILLVVCTTGCYDPKELPPEQYMRWVSSEKNGFIKTKKVRDVNITARYLPSQYLAYKEYLRASQPQLSFDSVWSAYKCALTFQLTISADKSGVEYGDLMHKGLSEIELAARTHYMSFSADKFILLRYEDRTIEPVLAVFEGYDQFTNCLSFQAAFLIPEYQCGAQEADFKDIIVSFEDPFWNLGTNNFKFSNSVTVHIPKIKLN